MSEKLLLVIKKHTDTFIKQTKTRPQETLEFVMDRRMKTFSFNPPTKLVEEDKRLLSVTSVETTNSVFNIANKSNSFSVRIPFHCSIASFLEDNFTVKQNNLLKLKPENDIESHVKEEKKVRK